METEITKKSYYLPAPLMEFFTVWCKPGREYSQKIAGAILFYMTLPPDVREKAEKLAYTEDIDKALDKLKPSTPEAQVDLVGRKEIKQLVDRVQLLLQAQAKHQGRTRARPRAKNA